MAEKTADQFSKATGQSEKRMQDFAQHLPAKESLPDNIKSFLSSIEGLPRAEQAALTNDFVNGYLKYDLPPIDQDAYRTFEELLQNPVGDCDDYSIFSASLLVYVGTPLQDIIFIGGFVQYELGGHTIPALHAFASLKGDNGKLYVLDQNLSGAPEIKPKNFPIEFKANSTSGPTVNVSIQDTFYVFDATGHVLKNRAPSEEVMALGAKSYESIRGRQETLKSNTPTLLDHTQEKASVNMPSPYSPTS